MITLDAGLDGTTSDQGPILSVIAPCLDEEGNIDGLSRRTLATFDAMGIRAELLLVDDGSTDHTWERICQRCAADGRVRGVRNEVNLGMVGAWRAALGQACGRFICLIDADLQNRPEDIAPLYAAHLRGVHDVTQAVRCSVPGLRRCLLFSRGLNFLLNLAFGMRSRDNKSGFILCAKDVLADVLRHRGRYGYFQSFLGASVHARGYTIGEVETVFEQRYHGHSFLSRFPLAVCARILWELLKFRIETWTASPEPRGFSPREGMAQAKATQFRRGHTAQAKACGSVATGES